MIRTVYLIALLLGISSTMIYSHWTQSNEAEGGPVLCIEKAGQEIWAGTESGLYITKDEE